MDFISNLATVQSNTPRRRPRPHPAFHPSSPFLGTKFSTNALVTKRNPSLQWKSCASNPSSSSIPIINQKLSTSTIQTKRITIQLPTPLGISLTETRKHDGLTQVLVSRVHDHSPANGRIRAGDIIVSPTGSLEEVVNAIQNAPNQIVIQLQRSIATSTEQVFNHNALQDAPDEPGQANVLSQHDDIYAHQNSGITNLISAYITARKLGSGEHARKQLLKVASQIVKSRTSTNSKSIQLIYDVLYRLKRVNVPLDARFYNILMSSLIQAGDPARATQLFEEIDYPNVECYTTLIKAYSTLKRPDDGIALIPAMRQSGVAPNIRTYNALIASCVRAGQLEKAQQLFSEMLVDKIKPNAVSWNIIINWHVQQSLGTKRIKAVLQAFRDMKASGVTPNIVTFTTIMKAYCKSGALNKAEEVFAEMKQILPNDIDTNAYNTLIQGYSSRLEWRRCVELLSEMKERSHGISSFSSNQDESNSFYTSRKVPVHSRSFTTKRPWLENDMESVSSNLQNENHNKATKKSSSAKTENNQCIPNEVTYSMVIKATANAGRPYLTREIFNEMIEKKFFPPPGSAVVSLMSVYAKAGMLSDSFNVLKSLKSWGVFPDIRMMTSLMHGCLVAKQPELALSVYAKLKSSKFSGDIVTHTNLLRAYGMLKQHEKAFNILKGLRKKSSVIKPNIVIYNSLIECCLMDNRTNFALKALELLLADENANTQLNRQTFEALTIPLRGLNDVVTGQRIESESMEKESMKENELSNETILQYLMDVLRRLRESKAAPNGELYHALLIACDWCDEWYLGSNLVEERRNGGFTVSQKDQRNVWRLEDYFRTRAITAKLGQDRKFP